MRTIISEERLRAMLEKMLLKENTIGSINTSQEYILESLPDDAGRKCFALSGTAAAELLNLLTQRLPAYGQYFETASRLMVYEDKGRQSTDLNPEESDGQGSNSPFFDYIEANGTQCTLDINTNTNIVTINEPLVTVKSTYGALDFSGPNAVKKIPKILDFILDPSTINTSCRMLKMKAGAVFVALNPKKTLVKKKLVYTVVYTVPEEPNIAIIKSPELVASLDTLGKTYNVPVKNIYQSDTPIASHGLLGLSMIESKYSKIYDLIKNKNGISALLTLMSYASSSYLLRYEESTDDKMARSPLAMNYPLQYTGDKRSYRTSVIDDMVKSLTTLKTEDVPAYSTLSERIDRNVLDGWLGKLSAGKTNAEKMELGIDYLLGLIENNIKQYLSAIKEKFNPVDGEIKTRNETGIPIKFVQERSSQPRVLSHNKTFQDVLNNPGLEFFSTTFAGMGTVKMDDYLKQMYNSVTIANIDKIASATKAMIKTALVDENNLINQLVKVKISREKIDAETLFDPSTGLSALNKSQLTLLKNARENLEVQLNSSTPAISTPTLQDYKLDSSSTAKDYLIYKLDNAGIPRIDITDDVPGNYNSFYTTLFSENSKIIQHLYDLEISVRPGEQIIDDESLNNPLVAELQAIQAVVGGTLNRVDSETRTNLMATQKFIDDQIDNLTTTETIASLSQITDLFEAAAEKAEEQEARLSPDDLVQLANFKKNVSKLGVLMILAGKEDILTQLRIVETAGAKITEYANEAIQMIKPKINTNDDSDDSDTQLEEVFDMIGDAGRRLKDTLTRKAYEITPRILNKFKDYILKLTDNLQLEKLNIIISDINDIIESHLKSESNNLIGNARITTESSLYSNVLQDIMEAAIKKRKSVKRK